MAAAAGRSDAISPERSGKEPPRLSGGLPFLGHLLEMRRTPIELFQRLRDECGEIGELRLAGRRVVMLSGEEAQEAFFRAPDEQLDQASAYPFMTPIFGKGVVFDATPEERQQMLKNQALRGDMMRGHASTIEAEIRRMVADWGDEGEIDLLDFFAELTHTLGLGIQVSTPVRVIRIDAGYAVDRPDVVGFPRWSFHINLGQPF